jgi:hypothetical protein
MRIAELIREKNDATVRYEEMKRNHEFLLTQMVSTNTFALNAPQPT